jgi:hypothetical protein
MFVLADSGNQVLPQSVASSSTPMMTSAVARRSCKSVMRITDINNDARLLDRFSTSYRHCGVRGPTLFWCWKEL